MANQITKNYWFVVVALLWSNKGYDSVIMTLKTPRLTDQELLAGVRSQSRAGAEALYDCYAKAILLAIVRLVPDLPSANAILCETYQIVWQEINTYPADGITLLGWMMRVARNQSEIHCRKNSLLKTIHLSASDVGDQ